MTESEQAYWHRLHGDYVAEMKRLNRDRLVVSAVICAEGQVLLVRRAPSDSYPGMWEFPGGGVDEIDQDFEHIVDALRREVFEETAIRLPEIPTGEVLAHPTRTALRIVLRFDIDQIPEVVLSHEHDEFRFVNEKTSHDQVGKDIIIDTMREENRGILTVVLNNS